MRVLGFGTYDTRLHPRIGVILQGLRDTGVTVDEANVPLGLSTADKVAMLRRPWKALRLIPLLASRWATISWRGRRAVGRSRKDGGTDAVIVGYMGQFDVLLARLVFPFRRIYLDQMVFAADTATDRGSKAGVKVRVLGLLDRLSVACASAVIVDTQEQLTLVPERRRDRAVVVPVGSPPEWFAARRPAQDAADTSRPLSVVFFGLFTPLQGAELVGKALGLLADNPDVTVTMIGKGQDLEAAKAHAANNPRVSWTDWVESEALPAVVAGHDVCLGIMGTTPKALRVVPNKVYQGAAAGTAIVTSDTEPQRRTFGADAVLVAPGEPAALADALAGLAADRELVVALRRAAGALADRAFTPAAVVAPLLAAAAR